MKKVKSILIAIVCISLVVGFYYYLSHRTPKSVESTTEISKVEQALSKNLSTSYPAKPREVIKYYNRLLTCVYNEEYTEEEFQKLAEKIRGLLDDELLEENPQEQYVSDLKADVLRYKDEGKVIANALVCDSDDVELVTIDSKECAYLTSSYYTKSDLAYNRTNQKFLLRKDEDGKWKILGFTLEKGEDKDAKE